MNTKAFLIPVFGNVIFPGNETKVKIDKNLAENLKIGDNIQQITAIALSVKKNKEGSKSLKRDDFFKTGTALEIKSINHGPEGHIASVKGLYPVNVTRIDVEDSLFAADFSDFIFTEDLSAGEELTLLKQIKNTILETGRNFRGSEEFLKYIENISDIDTLIETVIPIADISIEEKMELLSSKSRKAKYLVFMEVLFKQKSRVDLQVELTNKLNEKTGKQYRKALLREQLKAIQDELNENEGGKTKIDEYREKIAASSMSSEAEKTALTQLQRLEDMGLNSSESHIIQNYLDLLIELPWESKPGTETDLAKAKQIMDRDHYGLEKVKERILQHLAVLKLKKEKQGSILLLVGPPGTGKTSLGKSIASALEREYVRASLGGVRDEAEIRGHRRTYVGALPGRIINGIRKAGTKNPVFILDEIDKISVSYSGDPSAALLEVLDPEQNSTFSDNYLEVPYDLSDVFFIATANSTGSIPAPLLDRMEIIEISGYTNLEKFHIAENHLIPEVLSEHGLNADNISFSDEAVRKIIEKYTLEAGVRNLKKQISAVARHSSLNIAQKKAESRFIIDEETLENILGNEKIRHDRIKKKNIPGVVTGLAWTPVGGEILLIETAAMPGKGELILTGQLGDVMKESARISVSLIRSRLPIISDKFSFSDNDFHIHVPSGATPKDGPSAGITLFTAIASLITGKPVASDLAMTGEITLRGDVLPIGGLKEKTLAAHRAGVRHVLIPEDNKRDLNDIPKEILAEMEITPVGTIDDVLKFALDIQPVGQNIIYSGSKNAAASSTSAN